MANFVKTLFTSVPMEGTLKSVSRMTGGIVDAELPKRMIDYMKLVSQYVRLGAFTLGEEEFKHHPKVFPQNKLNQIIVTLSG